MSAMWVHNSNEILLPEKDVLFFILMHLFEKVKIRSTFGRGFKKALLKLILLSFDENSLSFFYPTCKDQSLMMAPKQVPPLSPCHSVGGAMAPLAWVEVAINFHQTRNRESSPTGLFVV